MKVTKIYEEMRTEKMILVKWVCEQLIYIRKVQCEQLLGWRNYGYRWRNSEQRRKYLWRWGVTKGFLVISGGVRNKPVAWTGLICMLWISLSDLVEKMGCFQSSQWSDHVIAVYIKNSWDKRLKNKFII